jgi:hypothetical protein
MKRDRAARRLRRLIALYGIVCLALALVRAGAVSARRLAAQPASSVVVQVSATEPWQSTGVVVRAGERIEIRVTAGSWTIGGHWGYTDGNGNVGAAADSYMTPELPGNPPGELIGEIGAQIFGVGDYRVLVAPAAGVLELAINDNFNQLADNAGALTVAIADLSSPPRAVVPVYPTGAIAIPPGIPVRFAWRPFPGAANYLLHIWLVHQAGRTPITARTRIDLAALVLGRTGYVWREGGFLPGTYEYALLPLDRLGNALAGWSAPIALTIYAG